MQGNRVAPTLRKPVWPASLLVSLGVRALPGGLRRDRYRQEFLAELYGMTAGRQIRHALQVVASSWSLRSATSNPNREGTTMLTTLRSKPLLCLLNIHHRYHLESSPDGHRYERCVTCGKDRMDYPWGMDLKGRNTIGG